LKVSATRFDGVLLFRAETNRDERGYFARLFDRDVLADAGCVTEFPQWSVAYNDVAGTLRGLHWSAPPHEEAKVVRVVAGAVYDVLVDLRPGSPTRGRHLAFELREADAAALYVPAGFAHGYQTLVDRTYVAYAISCAYVPAAARGINASDPALRIGWPLPVSVISERDRALPSLADALRAEGAWSR